MNPFDAGSVVKVLGTTVDGSGVHVTFPTVAGKLYVLQATSDLANPASFTALNPSVEATGDGGTMVLTAAADGASRFYRVLVQDQDSDSDTLSDWAERLTGTDPGAATTAANASGGAATDAETLRSLMSVTATTVDADAVEKEGTPARLRLTRTYGSMPLTIPFSASGAASPAKGSATLADVTFSGATSSSVTIPDGVVNHDIVVNPVQDGAVEVPETLNLTFNLPGLAGLVPAPTAQVMVKDAAVTTANRRLYVAYLGREAGVSTTATGVATALVEGDAAAVISLTFSNLSSTQNTAYIRTGNGLEVFRIPNGQVSGLSWSIRAANILLTDQAALDALVAGSLYVSVSSANFQGGEIRGTITPATGSATDPPDPDDPPTYGSGAFPNLAAGGVTNNPELDRDIARFLMQATYGPTPESIQEVRDLIAANGNDAIAGYTAWINKQMSTAAADAPSPSLVKLVQAADVEEFILRGNKPITYSNDPQFAGNSFQWNTSTRVDQYAAVLASWLGVPVSELPDIFPNLTRFSASPFTGILTPDQTPNLGFQSPLSCPPR